MSYKLVVDLAEMRETEVQRIQIAGNSPDKSNRHRLSISVESFVSEMNQFEITHWFFLITSMILKTFSCVVVIITITIIKRVFFFFYLER